MSHRPNIPPHLEEIEKNEKIEAYFYKNSKIGPQGVSKYGPGGRRIYKARGRNGGK